ncbi:MAG: lantibiotic dehydratase family protein, partial [Actinomycetota bacterium]|nr:lantibiotic dehydratase family protein [Actinomycetota bacterium]
MNAPAARYVPLSPVLVRAPVLPVDAYLALAAGPDAADAPLAPTDPLVRAALAVASPELLEQLDSLRPGTRDADRAAAALERYLIRMSTRPTPFGMFAAVGLADLGDETDLRVQSGPPRTRMRPDMEWLLRFVARLEDRPDVRRELRVTANPSAWTHGDRVLLAERTAVDGSGGLTAVDMRASGVVRRALALAREPVAWRELTARLITATGATPVKVDGLLTELWRQSFLLTELRPPLTHPSPARHVEERLAGVPAARDERAVLTRLLADMASWDETGLAGRPQLQAGLSALAEQAVPTLHGPAVQVDAALRLTTGGIAARVADVAARATELLLRLGPPSATGGLDGYRRAFVSRYGADREVALLELLDPERGLGPPSAAAAGPSEDAAGIGRRHAYLRRIALEALRDGHTAVRLDADAVAALAPPGPPGERAPVSVDLAVAVLA